MSFSKFVKGEQPCNDFNPQIEMNEQAMWVNEHQCYKCGGVVSYCVNCGKDHHEDGYENCIKKEE
jgi:hypothetical protein